MLLLNNAVALVPETLVLVATGEASEWGRLLDGSFGLADGAFLLASCACGLLIGWSSIQAQVHISATSMMVLGNVNRIFIISGSALLLGEQYSAVSVGGVALALGGGAWYAYTRIQLANETKQDEPVAEPAAAAGPVAEGEQQQHQQPQHQQQHNHQQQQQKQQPADGQDSLC